MATQVEGSGGRALAWWRGLTWDSLVRLPGAVGFLILVITFFASLDGHVPYRWAWVAGGAVLMLGNYLWLKDLHLRDSFPEFRRKYDIKPNPNALALEKRSIWHQMRCKFAFWLLYRAALAAPFPSEERAFFGRCWEERNRLFSREINIEKPVPDTTPLPPSTREKYAAFMLAHPRFEGVVWFIPGALLAALFGFMSFIGWTEDDHIGFPLIVCMIIATVSTIIALAGLWRIAQGWPTRTKTVAKPPPDAPFRG
jgi:hypothetical protein